MPDDTPKRKRTTKANTTASGVGRTGGAQARGRVTEDERERMRQLARDGKSVRAIAKQLGRSADSVSRTVRDIGNERREQTAAATQQRAMDFAAERTRLMEQTMRASRLAMSRFIQVETGDHRGSLDESRAFNSMVAAYAKLDERHTRAQGTQNLSDVDAYLDWMDGGNGAQMAAYLPDNGAAG